MIMPRLLLSAGTAALIGLSALSAHAFGPERFDVRNVQVKSVLGSVDIQVDQAATGVTVQARGGDQTLLDRLTVRQSGDGVVLDMDLPRQNKREVKSEDMPTITVTVPTGANLTIGDMIGKLEAQSGLERVDIALNSAASMEFGSVGTLTVGAHGALNLKVGEVRDGMQVTLHGASNVNVGRTAGPVELSVRGVGNVEVERVDGPVRLSLNGIGRISVEEGRAEKLDIDANGMGAISFGGEAAQRTVSKSGMARITYQGKAL